jgi:GNAT superfamily N-acetyltransferase
MTALVRPVRFQSDEPALLDLLQTNLPYRQHADYFQWLYRDNPAGEALALVAVDPDSQQIIGAAAAFPRLIHCSGATDRGFVLGDFCIHPTHRSLGLALTLQRACLEGISTPQPAFAFDFPSQTMLAIYKRLRIEVNGAMIRYAKPLRADRQIASRLPVPVVARGLSLVVNAGLQLRDRGKRAGDWTIALETGSWGEEFTEAALEWSPRAGICVLRTADYLNWRYRRHPAQSYEMWTARQNGKLRGYLILHVNGEDGTIDDLLAESDPVTGALLAEATALARQRGLHTLDAPWLATHSGGQILEQSGFQARESHPAVLLAPAQPGQPAPEANHWYLTGGDSEA